MNIRQPVKNTFDRVGIDYKALENSEEKVEVANWLTGETTEASELVARCVSWVYATQLAYERGNYKVNLVDFDRVRHWILEQDNENGTDVYMTCID